MRSVVIHYVARVGVRRCAVFALELTTARGIESVAVVGHW